MIILIDVSFLIFFDFTNDDSFLWFNLYANEYLHWGYVHIFYLFFFNISRLVKAFLEFRCTIKHFSKDIVFICYFIRIQFKGWVHCHSFRKQLVSINFINSLRSSILISRFVGAICSYPLAFLHKFQ